MNDDATYYGAGWPGKPRSRESEETMKPSVFWANLGFVVGSEVTVISAIGGNVIVNIKDSRVAINQDMARHIMVA